MFVYIPENVGAPNEMTDGVLWDLEQGIRVSGRPKVQPGGFIMAQSCSVVVQLYQFIHPPGPACILTT